MGEIKIRIYDSSYHSQKLIQNGSRHWNYKILGENIGVNLYGVGLSHGFLDTTPKAHATKGKR